MTTLTIYTNHLARHLSNALKCASSDIQLPSLCAVRLAIRGKALYLWSTDRYVLYGAGIPDVEDGCEVRPLDYDGHQDTDVMLSVTDVKTILGVLNANKSRLQTATVELDHDQQTLTINAHVQLQIQLDKDLNAVTFPDVHQLLHKDELEAKPKIGFDPRKLIQVCRLDQDEKKPSRRGVVIETDAARATRVRYTCDPSMVSLVMPIRIGA